MRKAPLFTRRTLGVFTSATLLASLCGQAAAQAYPAKPIRLVEGDTVFLDIANGGGWGDPLERDPAMGFRAPDLRDKGDLPVVVAAARHAGDRGAEQQQQAEACGDDPEHDHGDRRGHHPHVGHGPVAARRGAAPRGDLHHRALPAARPGAPGGR